MTWRLLIETIEGKAFRTFIRAYSLFKSGQISLKIKLTLQKILITSVLTYSYIFPVWEFAAYIQELQPLQNRGLRKTGRFPSCTPDRELPMAFQVSLVFAYITKLFRQ
jgi:hypothetical protein